MGGITGGTIPAKIWHDIMLVATEPYGNSDFEYPEVVLNPFKASSVTIIPQGADYQKILNEEKEKDKEKDNDNNKDEIQTTENIKNSPPIPPVVKPFPLKSENLSTSKKDTSNTDTPIERVETPSQNYAPIPLSSAPIGQ